MTKDCFLVKCVAFVFILSSCQHEKESRVVVAEQPVVNNNMRSYLVRAASEISDSSINDNSTLKDWEDSGSRRYNEFIEMMGLKNLPLQGKRSNLNVKITGIIKKEGYRIEKLYYESLPGLYVRANLYVPDSIKSPRPAILYVSGHSRKAKEDYQAHPRKFAQMGFVSIILETIQFGEVIGEHWGPCRNGLFNWYSRGYNPAGVELWNAIRAIDLLCERPEVDPEKIGVTGISGGGSQTWYIAASDPRIKAAAPVCGAATLKSHIITRTVDGHCDCMMPNNTYRSDFEQIGALIAPRPLLVCQANLDGMFSIEAVRELVFKTKKIYDTYGKRGNISLVETPGEHSYHKNSRESIFAFFMEHLDGKKVTPEQAGDIDTASKNQLTSEELKVFVNGPPKDDRTPTIQNSFIALAPATSISSKEALYEFRDSVKNFLHEKTFGAFPKKEVLFDAQHEFKSMDTKNSGNHIYSIVTEDGWRLKIDIHWKDDSLKKKPLLIVLRNYNENLWSSEAFAAPFEKDWNVAFFEPRGTGETGWDPNLQWHIRRAAAWTGRTIASMQVYDVLRCLKFCRTLKNIDTSKIGVAAKDEMGAVALYASLMDGNCNTVVLRNPPPTQDVADNPDGRGPAIEMLNCLQVTDINQLPALLAPAKIIFVGKVPDSYLWSEKMLKQFEHTGFERL
ncbi:MAG TPA: acetylxylan esterase [Flavitalea sp.]|nr:acetylxylan esterase [Flavitalea sp.]